MTDQPSGAGGPPAGPRIAFGHRPVFAPAEAPRPAAPPPRPDQPAPAFGPLGPDAALVPAVRAAYATVLRRDPRPEEIEHWTGTVQAGLLSPAGVLLSILTSVEAMENSRSPAPPAPPAQPAPVPVLLGDTAPVIRRLYELFYHRTASNEEVALWQDVVDAQAISMAGLLDAIATSPEAVAKAASPAPAAPAAGTLHQLREAIRYLYDLTFQRVAGPDEVDHWAAVVNAGTLSLAELVAALATSAEAQDRRSLLPELSDGVFMQVAYEMLLGRGANANEVASWQQAVAQGHSKRQALLQSLFCTSALVAANGHSDTFNDATRTHLLGTGRSVDLADWQAAEPAAVAPVVPWPTRYAIITQPSVLVTAVASLYRGEAFIERFLDNITGQSVFGSHCELVIVDANSPENERPVIERYMAGHKNIRYVRTPNRIGIYDAWNVGVTLAAGQYITNANMDDLRRTDSFELQAAVLDNLGFVDVVYQDVFYSFTPDLTFDAVAARGFASNVPVVTPNNLLSFNSPHNGPMWRKRLHDEVGMFDVGYKSAGDFDFWLRCIRKGKRFFKINDPHVVYYVNPTGISTRPDTRGIVESNRITREHARHLVSPDLASSAEDFLGRLHALSGHPAPAGTAAGGTHWRYTAAQAALRAVSQRSRGVG